MKSFLKFKKQKRLLKSKNNNNKKQRAGPNLPNFIIVTNFPLVFSGFFFIFSLLDPDPGEKMTADPCGPVEFGTGTCFLFVSGVNNFIILWNSNVRF